jgi:hypothetical protein
MMTMTASHMPKVVSREEWLRARQDLLVCVAHITFTM